MRLVFLEAKNAWGIMHGAQPVAIGGTTFFEEREAAVAEIAKRGLVVLADGQILRPEEVPAPEPDPLVEEILEEFSPDVPTAEAPAPQPPTQEQGDVIDEIDGLIESTTTETDVPAEETAPKRAGRPRQYTPEEAKERHRERNRAYYHRSKEARKEENSRRAKQWWAEHPDKVKEYRERANARRRERYAKDAEFRKRVAESNRAYKERQRASGGAEEAAQ